MKWYAVRAGRFPGIFTSWPEASKAVTGFSGAVFKSFSSLEDAQAFLAGEKKVVLDGVHVYTDGCHVNGVTSWAFVVYESGVETHHESGLVKNTYGSDNVAGELAAAVRAVNWAIGQGVEMLVLHHDYLGVAEHALGTWRAKTESAQVYAGWMKNALQKIEIQFVHCQGHSGVPGNERADELARKEIGRS